MNTKDRIKQLAIQRKITIAELERKLHIANGTIGKWDKQNPSIEPLKKLADYFGVTTDYLLGRTDTPEFTTKDEKDVQQILENLINGLSNENSLAFLKNGGVEIDEEDAELLRDSLERTVRRSKILAKEKFTPKKYRKNDKSE
ncbi:hypothetical protein IGJ48_002925 [Enterococcus pernyi]